MNKLHFFGRLTVNKTVDHLATKCDRMIGFDYSRTSKIHSSIIVQKIRQNENA